MQALMTLTQYAKYRRVHPASVRRAVASGRIREALRRSDGTRKRLLDPVEADRLWLKNTRYAKETP